MADKSRNKRIPYGTGAGDGKRTLVQRMDHHLRCTYGFSYAGFLEMLVQQRCKCAICKRQLIIGRGGTDVDHCHRTGKIRGLLCHPCNLSLGHVEKDEGKWLKNALAYIKRST